VLDNAQWLSNTQWRATYDITSLVPRGTYTMSVSSAKGTDGMEIPTDTRFAFTVDYAGQITDQTPPPPPSVFATGKPSDVSAVEATWSATDPESAIIGYRYAIGSAAGTADIVNWTTTTATSISRSGLGLVAGRQYWLAVQAKNAGGLWSASANRSFVAGQQTKVSTTTAINSPTNPSVIGQSVTFTATVSVVAPGIGTPTGTVTFNDGATQLGIGTVSAGIATFTTSSLALGSHTITAVYGGDTNFAESTSPTLIQVVNQGESRIHLPIIVR
jgi:hypothetical protein